MNAETKVKAATGLNSALVKALAEIEGAAKDKVNPAFKSKYADIASVIDAIRPVLARYDLGFTQHCHPDENGVSVETFLHHAGGDSLSMGTLYVPANKRDPQGFGSALTYCRRYALMTAFGVPAEDDDGNAAAKSAPVEKPEGISDSDRDMIATLAEAAGKTLQEICAAYKIASLKELNAKQGAALIAKLRTLKKETADVA